MSIDPQPRNPRTVRVQLVSRTERPTPATKRAAPANKPRLNRSLRDRDRFTRACASRRVIDPSESPDRPGVTFSRLPHTTFCASAARCPGSVKVGGTMTGSASIPRTADPGVSTAVLFAIAVAALGYFVDVFD